MRPFEEDLKMLKGKLQEMGSLVANSIHRSVRSLFEQSEDFAHQALRDGARVNQLEIQIDDMATTLIALNYVVAWLSARHPPVRRLVEGAPVELARDGHIFREVLKRELVSRADFDKAMRESGCGELDHIHKAILETNGHITIVTRKEADGG